MQRLITIVIAAIGSALTDWGLPEQVDELGRRAAMIFVVAAVPHEGLLVVLVALSCSFAMALPISTPPNALSFGTGRIQLRDLVKVGGLMAVIAVILVVAGYRIMLPLTLPVGG